MQPLTDRMCALYFTNCGMEKSACHYHRSVKMRTWWAETTAGGRVVENLGAVF